MAENKTQPTSASALDYLNDVKDESKRHDCLKILALFQEISNQNPVMWGDSIIGFGTYHYKYASGREGDFMRLGFSPRKQNISLYIFPGANKFPELLAKLGKHKTGKSCLYINKLADIDVDVLAQLVKSSLKMMRELYPE